MQKYKNNIYLYNMLLSIDVKRIWELIKVSFDLEPDIQYIRLLYTSQWTKKR